MVVKTNCLNNSMALPLFKSNKWYEALKYTTIFFIFVVVGVASVNYSPLTPFAFGLFFALINFKLNYGVLSIVYFLAMLASNFILGFDVHAILCAVNVIIVSTLLYFTYKKLKRSINKVVLGVSAVLANVYYLYIHFTSPTAIIVVTLAVVLGIIFMFACLNFLKATIVRGFNFRLNLDETICGGIMLIVFSMGLTHINIFGIETIKVFAVLSVLITTYIFKGWTSLFVGAIVGVGASLYTLNLSYVAVFVLYGLLCKAFKSNNKIFSCVALLLAEILFGFYFSAYENFGIISLASVIIGEIIFILLPINSINKISDFIGGTQEKVGIRNIVNHSKEGIYKRMIELSTVFSDMDTVFRNMVKGVLPQQDAKKMLTSEVMEKCCKDNPELNRLLRVDAKTTTEVFENLIDIGFERGKITLLDIPQYLTSRVPKVNYLINLTNQLLASYKHYATMVGGMDSSRILIAEQLNGVGTILRDLAEEVKLNISFDLSKENRIIEELTYKNVYCVEAIVYEQSMHIINITLVIKQNDFNEAVIEKTISKIVGSTVGVISVMPSAISGCNIITLKTKPNYDIVFGSASAGKNGEMVNGDSHSLIKISDAKYMMALCDGMGSGQIANTTSSLSINLIENFYKAGFSSEIILNSVNKLLGLNNDENYSTLDLCIIDIRSAICDFIKLGSPYGLIKHKNSTEIIETSGLPIGVLEEMQPHVTKKVLTDFDIIILMSDGIIDSFASQEELTLFVNNINSTNPQTISDEILDRAVDNRNGVCGDDMTVLAVRVFPLT